MRLSERIVRHFAAAHPAEAAQLLGDQTPQEVAALLSRLPEESAAAILGLTPPPVAAGALALVEPEAGGRLLARLPGERAAALLRRLDRDSRERLLAELPGGDRLRPLLVFPEGTAGALMDPKVLALPGDLGLEDVRRRLGRHSEHLALELYVVDRDQRLLGVVDLRDVLDVSRNGPLATLVRPIEPLRASADTAAMNAHPGWDERSSLPVVDERGTYLGAVRAERLRQLTRGTTTRRASAEREAVRALGELYWLGLSGAFTGLALPESREEKP